jgi:hypothetical protein
MHWPAIPPLNRRPARGFPDLETSRNANPAHRVARIPDLPRSVVEPQAPTHSTSPVAGMPQEIAHDSTSEIATPPEVSEGSSSQPGQDEPHDAQRTPTKEEEPSQDGKKQEMGEFGKDVPPPSAKDCLDLTEEVLEFLKKLGPMEKVMARQLASKMHSVRWMAEGLKTDLEKTIDGEADDARDESDKSDGESDRGGSPKRESDDDDGTASTYAEIRNHPTDAESGVANLSAAPLPEAPLPEAPSASARRQEFSSPDLGYHRRCLLACDRRAGQIPTLPHLAGCTAQRWRNGSQRPPSFQPTTVLAIEPSYRPSTTGFTQTPSPRCQQKTRIAIHIRFRPPCNLTVTFGICSGYSYSRRLFSLS